MEPPSNFRFFEFDVVPHTHWVNETCAAADNATTDITELRLQLTAMRMNKAELCTRLTKLFIN